MEGNDPIREFSRFRQVVQRFRAGLYRGGPSPKEQARDEQRWPGRCENRRRGGNAQHSRQDPDAAAGQTNLVLLFLLVLKRRSNILDELSRVLQEQHASIVAIHHVFDALGSLGGVRRRHAVDDEAQFKEAFTL